VGTAAQAVGDGRCHTCLVIYPTGNLEGRYRRGGENADDYARGARPWTAPWGNHGGNDFINIFPHGQYCLKYGGKHDDLAPFVVNQHRNGLLTPWGYNATHNVPQLTIDDYVNSRYILNPLRLWDCDRPVNASSAYLFTTAERARDMRQSPVYRLLKELLELGKRLEQSLPTVKEIVETPIIKILAGEVIIALKKFVPYNYRPTVAVHHPHSMHDQISFVYQIVRGRPYCIAFRVGNRFNSVLNCLQVAARELTSQLLFAIKVCSFKQPDRF
jgi:hypothetical protein